MTIETVRLQLIPYSPAQLLALLEGIPQFEEQFGLVAAEGLRDFYVSEAVSPDWLARLRASTEMDLWLHGFAIVHRESHLVIGGAGFTGPPDTEGVVEIGYGIVPGYQGNGFATEAAEALIAFAFGSGRVHRVRAHTLPLPNASTRVLTKCGFECVGELVVPEDGLVWRWERAGETA